MKKLFVLLALAVPLLANAEVVQYRHNRGGGFTVLTTRLCPKDSHAFMAFQTNAVQRVTRTGCWIMIQGQYAIVWLKGEHDSAAHPDTILSPSSLSYADLDDE
jgi:hypothetical protein